MVNTIQYHTYTVCWTIKMKPMALSPEKENNTNTFRNPFEESLSSTFLKKRNPIQAMWMYVVITNCPLYVSIYWLVKTVKALHFPSSSRSCISALVCFLSDELHKSSNKSLGVNLSLLLPKCSRIEIDCSIQGKHNLKNERNYLHYSPTHDTYCWWSYIAFVTRLGGEAAPADIVQLVSPSLPSRAWSQTFPPTHTFSFQLNNHTNNSLHPCTVPQFVLFAF